MGSYGQFCPVAKAMELLDERWTMLVVRELVLGSRHFSDLQRGVPRMSPTLLSKRLHTLVRAGVVQRTENAGRVVYRLTAAGEELAPIVDAVGRWGVRWVPELGESDLDPHLLMWDIHRNVDLDAVPAGRTVLQFLFTDVAAGSREWWLLITPTEADVCSRDPGFDVRLTVETRLRTLVRVWRGDVGWSTALRSGELALHGKPSARRALPCWLKLSSLATTPRPGRPARLAVPA